MGRWVLGSFGVCHPLHPPACVRASLILRDAKQMTETSSVCCSRPVRSSVQAMLKGIREKVGYDKMLLTESNAEPFMRDLNMYLTLVGFAGGNLPPVPADSGSVIVPAFQSVYGGYVLFVGAEFFQEDFVNPDVFAAKVCCEVQSPVCCWVG